MQCYFVIGKNERNEEVRCLKEQEGPFCSSEHKEAWGKINYGPKKENPSDKGYSKDFLVQGMLKMAEEERQKRKQRKI